MVDSNNISTAKRGWRNFSNRISQIKMPNWSKPGGVEIGDATACGSLLVGEGTGLALTEAYKLADELKPAQEDHQQAFFQFHQNPHEYVLKK